MTNATPDPSKKYLVSLDSVVPVVHIRCTNVLRLPLEDV